MIVDFQSVMRLYHAAGSAFGWSDAFSGDSNQITIGPGHLDWTGQPFEVTGQESIYSNPTFDTPYGVVNKALKLFGRDPRPPAGRLTRR